MSAVVADRIRSQGPIGFDEFMDVALYDPQIGFYMRGGGAGRRRDFLTSPEVGPLFGAVLANALDAWWVELGRPDPFVVVDAGAGSGTLARSIRAAALGRVPTLCASCWSRSRRRCGPRIPTVSPAGPRSKTRPPVVVLANELLDNLPVAPRRAHPRGLGRSATRPRRGDARSAAPLADVERCVGLAPNAAPGARIPLQDRASAWLADALASRR